MPTPVQFEWCLEGHLPVKGNSEKFSYRHPA